MAAERTGDAKGAIHALRLLLLLLGTPLVVFYVTTSVLHFHGQLVWPDAAFLSKVAPPTAAAALLYVAWLTLQAALYHWLPGRIERGQPLANGARLPYRLNGLFAHATTLALAGALVATGLLPADLLYTQLGPLITTANLVVLGLCAYITWLGRKQASAVERRRSLLEAYVVGACLNPRQGLFDWKFFCESRPGMILWVLVDASLMCAQRQAHGEVSLSMWLVMGFQLLYVTDYFVFEDAILTTWDIRHEPFGFMLCWGSLVWVPFTFSLQAMYLVHHPVELSAAGALAITALNLGGYAVFRGANLQKHRFRRDRTTRIWGRPAEYIQTSQGTRLLTSGYWGLSRHCNYLGDLMMGLAWCLPTGFDAPVPYFYIVYFVILLVHRERRDQAHCAQKYGEAWARYTQRVPWRIVPWLY